uniref:Uncharacterized protein n=1 Tax=Bracon brevicornis TaxID=1563983 RepID=A0A6V7ILN3_9HYME
MAGRPQWRKRSFADATRASKKQLAALMDRVEKFSTENKLMKRKLSFFRCHPSEVESMDRKFYRYTKRFREFEMVMLKLKKVDQHRQQQHQNTKNYIKVGYLKNVAEYRKLRGRNSMSSAADRTR